MESIDKNTQKTATTINSCDVETLDDEKCGISINISDDICEVENSDEINAKRNLKTDSITIIELIDDDISVIQSCDNITSKKKDNSIDDEIFEIDDSDDDECAKNSTKIEKSSFVISDDNEICEKVNLHEKNITSSDENLTSVESATFGDVEVNLSNIEEKNNTASDENIKNSEKDAEIIFISDESEFFSKKNITDNDKNVNNGVKNVEVMLTSVESESLGVVEVNVSNIHEETITGNDENLKSSDKVPENIAISDESESLGDVDEVQLSNINEKTITVSDKNLKSSDKVAEIIPITDESELLGDVEVQLSNINEKTITGTDENLKSSDKDAKLSNIKEKIIASIDEHLYGSEKNTELILIGVESESFVDVEANVSNINEKTITVSDKNLKSSDKDAEIMPMSVESEFRGNVEVNLSNINEKNITSSDENLNDTVRNSELILTNIEEETSDVSVNANNVCHKNKEFNSVNNINENNENVASINVSYINITTTDIEVSSSELISTINNVKNISIDNSEATNSVDIVINPFNKKKRRRIIRLLKELASKPVELLTEHEKEELKFAKEIIARKNCANPTNSQQLPRTTLFRFEARQLRNTAQKLQNSLKLKTLNEQEKLALEWAKRNINVKTGDLKTSDHLIKLTKDEARKIRSTAQKLENSLKSKPLNEQEKIVFEWAERNKYATLDDIKTPDHMLLDTYLNMCLDSEFKNLTTTTTLNKNTNHTKVLTRIEAFNIQMMAAKIIELIKPLELSEQQNQYLDWAKQNLNVKQGDIKTETHKFPRIEEDVKKLNEAIEHIKMYKSKTPNELTSQDEHLFLNAKEFIMNYDYKLNYFSLTHKEQQEFQIAKRFIIVKQYKDNKKTTTTTLVKNPLSSKKLKRKSTTNFNGASAPKIPKLTTNYFHSTQTVQNQNYFKNQSLLPTFQNYCAQNSANSLSNPFKNPTPTTTTIYNENNTFILNPPQGLRISAAVYPAARYNQTPERTASISGISQYTQQNFSLKRQFSYDDISRASSNMSSSGNKPYTRRYNVPAHYIIIAILDVGRGDGSTLAANWKSIQDSLQMIYVDIMAANPGPPPICRDVGWFKGIAKLIACADERSVKLYKQAIHKLGEVWPGAKLRVVPQHSITTNPRSRAWIPAEPSTPKEILNLLRLSNPEVLTEGWKIAKISDVYNRRRQAVVILNRACLTQLLTRKGHVNYGFTSIFININRNDLWMAYSQGNTEDLSSFPDDTNDSTYYERQKFKDFVDLTYMSDSSDEADVEMSDNIVYVKDEI